jgi:hypothetical protein
MMNEEESEILRGMRGRSRQASLVTHCTGTRRKDLYHMNLKEIIRVVEGTALNPEVDTDIKIRGGYGADLMSDVLASSQPKAVLLTGLTNPQVVRTAQIAEFRAIIFVRGKKPQPETIEIATQEKLPLVTSPFGMFELCGRLRQAGLPSFESNVSSS